MSNAKPIVNVATACEKVLVEKDDVLSLLRIVDIFYIPDGITEAIPEVVIPVSGLIVVRGGDFIGEGELSVVIQTPDGSRSDPKTFPMIFGSSNQGNNVICHMTVSLKHLGISWAEVLWNGELLTKFPIKLEHKPKPADQSLKN
jgi:hypothetical protein